MVHCNLRLQHFTLFIVFHYLTKNNRGVSPQNVSCGQAARWRTQMRVPLGLSLCFALTVVTL